VNVFKEVQANLLMRREALSDRIRDIEDDLSRNHEEPDSSGAPVWESVGALAALIAGSHRELAVVDAALRRIAERTFDLCIHCGGRIPAGVLRIYPFAASCESCAQGFGRDYFEKIRGQHEDLRGGAGAVKSALAAVLDGFHSGAHPGYGQSAVRVVLGIFRRDLEAHFQLEEDSQYFDDLVAAAPRLSRRVAKLRLQHPEMLDQLDVLTSAARSADKAELSAWQTLDTEFAQLAEDLALHERLESEIACNAYMDDAGGGD
jgi:RNA polymerase-binding transcription factor DksA